MRKFLVTSFVLLMMLTACGDKESSGNLGRGNSEPNSSQSTQVQLPLPGEEDVQFELDDSDPNFSALQQPSVDLSNTPDYTNQGVDGGAEGTGVGSPTGQPPFVEGGEDGGAGGSDGDGSSADDSEASGANASGAGVSAGGSSTVTPENKYPNTGLYPEDDD